MAERSGGTAALKITDLHVYYGESHAIQGVSMSLDHGVLAVVGRNGMGKSTLCNTIAGLKASRSGSISVYGRETTGLEPHIIHRHGVGYVPQGRRVWPSLSVDEHLRLVAVGGREGQLDGRPRLSDLSPALRAAHKRRHAAFRRRAANARHRACAPRQSAAFDHGRADRRARSDHCRTGRSVDGEARRRRRDGDLSGRAEYRRRHRGRRQRRHHGQRPHQPPYGSARTRGRSRIAAAAAWRRPAGRRRQCVRTGTSVGRDRCRTDGAGLSRRTQRQCAGVRRSGRGALIARGFVARALEDAGEQLAGLPGRGIAASGCRREHVRHPVRGTP